MNGTEHRTSTSTSTEMWPMFRTGTPILAARLGSTSEDYTRMGIERGVIKPWEDGMRTDGSPGTYEWWYFDAHLDDGTRLVVVFQTKQFTDLAKPIRPVIRIDLTLPGGTPLQQLAEPDAETFSASAESCEVHIGDSVFAGDLHTYTIRARAKEVEVDITLTGQVPAWRPETGYWLFGDQDEHYFAWLPSVPQGRVNATYRIGNRSRSATGVGYHDHNWGNASMPDLIHHWYWARGVVGPYTVIASYITAQRRYGYDALPVFMLARDGTLIGEDPAKVTFEELGRYTDTATDKPVGNVTRYTYTDSEDRYVVTFTRHSDLVSNRFIDDLRGIRKAAARLAGLDGAYLRFAGELRIERFTREQRVESHVADALWELMYFGEARP